MKGLAYMNGDPKKINVLYAKVEECGSQPGILQQVVDGVVDLFHSNGRKCLFSVFYIRPS